MKEDEVGELCSTYGRHKYNFLFEKPEGKRPLGRPRYRWQNIINVNVKEMPCESVAYGLG
jgi:hypothetical protein